MGKPMQKELSLIGLNCNKCINDIKDKMKLENLNINFDLKDKALSFVVKDGSEYNRTMKSINKILNNHDHLIEINERYLENNENIILFIGKLSCNNCAKKIETKVKNINGVLGANLNFVNSKLNIEVKSKHDMARVLEETKIIVKTIEPSANLTVLEENKDHLLDNAGIVKKTLYTLFLSAVSFTIGLFVNIEIFKLILFLISYLIIGRAVLIKAIRSIFKANFFDENTLMMIATIGAFFIGEYYEAIAVMAFYLVGEMFQNLALDKSRKSIAALMNIKNDYANVKVNNEIIQMPSENVNIGSLIVVKPGEKVPLDGIIYEGKSNIDESSLRGESMPKYLSENEEILGGCVNLDNVLVIKTTKLYNDSTISKILELVENSSSKKAPTENFMTKFASVYTPIVVVIALLLAFLPPLINNDSFSIWLYRSLSFLVVSCPCALVISVPLGFYGGIGFASKNGILIKGGNYLEALKNAEEIVFDKTGTLTTGKFVVSTVNSLEIDKNTLLEIAAYAEYYSIHPIANAIKVAYNKEFEYKRIKKYQEYSGLGIKAIVDDQEILIGNLRLFDQENIKYAKTSAIGTIVYIAKDKKYLGNIVIADKIKEEAALAISNLRALGIKKISMLTGDKKDVAYNVANTLGIDEVFAEVLPNQKVEIIESKVKDTRKKIIFVGDGINDALVLARSNVGISMGTVGSDAAIEASDIVIMNDDLTKIATARQIAKKTSKIVWENIIFALLVKILVLIFAAIGFVDMWSAVFADVGVSLIAIFNASRILKIKFKNR